MKKLYSKPAMELLDLTVRERVAACGQEPNISWSDYGFGPTCPKGPVPGGTTTNTRSA